MESRRFLVFFFIRMKINRPKMTYLYIFYNFDVNFSQLKFSSINVPTLLKAPNEFFTSSNFYLQTTSRLSKRKRKYLFLTLNNIFIALISYNVLTIVTLDKSVKPSDNILTSNLLTNISLVIVPMASSFTDHFLLHEIRSIA